MQDLKLFLSLMVDEVNVKLHDSFLCFAYYVLFLRNCVKAYVVFMGDYCGFALFASSSEGFKSLHQHKS